MSDKYNDIIDLEHYTSLKHPRMSIMARSSQFAPFSALTGYSEAINNTAILTDKKIELDDNFKNIINGKLQILINNNDKDNIVSFTYFVKDEIKDGGKYITVSGIIKKFDVSRNIIVMKDKTIISIDDIIDVNSEVFDIY